jgi:glycosyltransferase involved in cell wall biosynthesis
MVKVSILLPTYNEESFVRDCLESVKWADEILVVDSYSTDSTLDIACEYGARIIQHEYINSAKQKNWAIPQCAHEWVLQIDSDERLDADLQAELKDILADGPPADVDGYAMPTKNHILGEWMTGMDLYPEYRLRLFRRDVGRFQDREVDARVVVPGRVLQTNGHCLHFGMESISRRIRPIDRYTRYEADERAKQGKRFTWVDFLGRPVAAFVVHFFLKGGYRAGFRGVVASFIKAEFLFWTYAKLWEKEWKAGLRK